MKLRYFARALRLPFLAASVLPFIFGSLAAGRCLNPAVFLLGLAAVCAVHLSANLINDYADSLSGADWQDRRFFSFFGGSKLIQENIFSAKFYFYAAFLFAAVAAAAIALLSVLLKSPRPLIYCSAIIFLSWAYSQKPLAFSCRRAGEIIIFLLFGPAPVMGGYYLQSGIFPDIKSFLLSLPFGFFTLAILLANEVPDYSGDIASGKFNWVGITGPSRAYWLYYLACGLGFAAIIVSLCLNYLGKFSLASLFCLPWVLRCGNILRLHYRAKEKLAESSLLTVKLQAAVGIILILSIFI